MNEQSLVQTDISMGMLQATSPKALVAGATEMANELAGVIESRKLYNDIGGKRFVRVEGWTTLGAMLGCVPREVSNERQDDGRYIAKVQLVRMSDQQIVSEASGECGAPGEARWGEADEYAKRSMAATRATSKAGRLAFSWIMVLAGFEATPAEEIDGKARQNIERQGSSKQAESSGGTNDAVVSFGKNKGKKWSEIDAGYLKWCVDNATNPKFKDLAQAELDRRAGGTENVSQAIVMASEQDIRLIRESAKAKDITVPEILEMFELDSMDKIRQIDCAPILKWIANPEEVPAKLAAF